MAKDLNIGSSSSAVNLSIPNGGIKDKNGSLGTDGQVLKSDGEKTYWDNVMISGCSARGTTNVTLNQNTPKKLTLNTIIANTDPDSFELYNGGIRCKKAGTVSVGGACYLSATKAGSIGTYIWLNSSELNSSLVYPGTASVAAAINVSPMIINVSANDVFYLYGRQTASAGTANASNVATHLSITYLAQ